jgi:hypothetical protein
MIPFIYSQNPHGLFVFHAIKFLYNKQRFQFGKTVVKILAYISEDQLEGAFPKVGDDITMLESPIDVMCLIHKALRTEANRVEKLAETIGVDSSLQAFKLAFNAWAMALVFHAEQEDSYITRPICSSPPTECADKSQEIVEIVRSAILAHEEEHRTQLFEAVEDVMTVLNEDIGRTTVITRTRQHLYGKVVSMRIVQEDYLDTEEALLLPLVRERFDKQHQLEAARRLLIDELADDKLWVIDWICQDLTPEEKTLLIDFQKSFSGPSAHTKPV